MKVMSIARHTMILTFTVNGRSFVMSVMFDSVPGFIGRYAQMVVMDEQTVSLGLCLQK